MLVLFYVEDLRRFILSSIKSTDRLLKQVDRLSAQPKRKGGQFETAREILVAEGVLSQSESDELLALVDYRNIIGHGIHRLTADIGAYSALMQLNTGDGQLYDYSAVQRVRAMRKKVSQGMMKRFVLPVSFDTLQFEAAERTFQTEIARLKKCVDKGLAHSNKVITDTNRVIGRIPKPVLEEAQPGHPRNFRANRTLSPQGQHCVFMLYEANATPLAVAYMMKVSLQSATRWFNKWKADMGLLLDNGNVTKQEGQDLLKTLPLSNLYGARNLGNWLTNSLPLREEQR